MSQAGPPAGRPVIVLDASAFLAYSFGETGSALVAETMDTTDAVISAVNLSEVASKLLDAAWGQPGWGAVLADVEQGDLGGRYRVEPFTSADALMAATLRPETRHLGLSAGDRACLALGRRLGAPVLTGDRAWASLPADTATVRLIR